MRPSQSGNDVRPAAPAWQDVVFKVLKEGEVRQIAHMPDAGHAHVIRWAIADTEIEDVLLTTEEEGVALACGAWLGGLRAVLLMQSGGGGNCVNMFSLLPGGSFPFLTLVTMRRDYAEFNPWRNSRPAPPRPIESMGITVLRHSDPEDLVELVAAGLEAAFGGRPAGGGTCRTETDRAQ